LANAEDAQKDYFVSLVRFLQSERKAGKKIYPPQDLVFNAFNLCPYDDVRVVIIGQVQNIHSTEFYFIN
jgi:uracil-DNA glycosylase